MVKSLLGVNPDVLTRDTEGNTPLLAATGQKNICLTDVVEWLIDSGSDVNETNNEGLTPLMLAAESKHYDAMHVLLKAKADVNIVAKGRNPHQTALSLLLTHWYPFWNDQRMASVLLIYGANANYVKSDVIHRIIAMGNGKFVQQLIASGLWPSDIVFGREFQEWPFRTISPLCISLLRKNLALAEYLIVNKYLTQSDVKILSGNKLALNYFDFLTCEVLQNISPRPPKLELLCFISISTALSSGLDREERVRTLPLPPALKESLLFKRLKRRYFKDAEENEESVIFCLKLTWSQHVEPSSAS
nr:serine/threonine-protein phosphatase 6 regulatory ankyrin repeat subunit B-like [Biomphalaria glabrata]